MRNKVRINNFLNKVDIPNLVNEIWQLNNVNIQRIIDNISDIKKEWLNFYDLRFSQILTSLGYLPNISGFWYYYEEDEILKMQGYKPRDYIFWGNIFDKTGNRLPEVNYILIKDMNTDHIDNLLKNGWVTEEHSYYKIFKNELLIRNRREKLKRIGKVL